MSEYVVLAMALVAILCLGVVVWGLRHMRLHPRPPRYEPPAWVPPSPASYDDLLRAVRGELARMLRRGKPDWSRPIEDIRRDLRQVTEHLMDVAAPLMNRIERERLIAEVVDGIQVIAKD